MDVKKDVDRKCEMIVEKIFRKTGVKWEQFGSFKWGKETIGIQVILK